MDSTQRQLGGVNPNRVTFDPSIQFVQTSHHDPVIDTIIVVGNRTTNAFVVFAEMELEPGDIATPSALKRDQERLESLHLFSRAKLKLGSMTNNRTALIVEVTELWYIWPGLYLAIDENDPTRASYGGIISHENFRGRREFLSVSGRYGYITGFDFEWDIPYLFQDNTNWAINFRGSFTNEDEPRFLKDREGVKSRQRLVSGKIGYRFNLENYAWMKLTARSRAFESHDDRHLYLTESENGEDLVGGVEFAVVRDTRTYKSWPDNAYLLRMTIGSGIGLNHSGTSFLKPELYASTFYTPWSRIHLASRVRGTTYLGNIPMYERVLLDRENGIRTAMLNVFEGRWRVLSSAELRADILPVQYFTFNIWDPADQYTRNLKFGISTTLFTDYGIVGGVDDPSPYSDSNDTAGWDVAYGAGLILHIPYRDMVRAEIMRSARYPSDGLMFRIRIGTFL
jgi:outer membrane protein assembly factor BamA